MVGISFIPQNQTPPRVRLAGVANELLHLQERMNVALELLLATRANMDSHHKELDLNTELTMHLNKAQVIKAIKEAEVHHTTAACILQQTHRENMLRLECKVKVEEGQDHQTFMEAFGMALWACLPENQGALMYPLHLLSGDMPAASIPIVWETLAPQGCAKCQQHSSNLKQEEEETVEPDHTTEGCPQQNRKREGHQQRLLKSPAVRPFPRNQQ